MSFLFFNGHISSVCVCVHAFLSLCAGILVLACFIADFYTCLDKLSRDLFINICFVSPKHNISKGFFSLSSLLCIKKGRGNPPHFVISK